MASSRHLEIEHKYDVSVDAVIPDLSGIEGIERIGEPTEHVLVASYFDTADLDLARHHVTLRRRRGGSDEGWHLKIETGADHREEHQLPLGRSASRVPAAFIDPVRWIVRDRTLGAVARVRTTRIEWPLLDAAGRTLALLSDDTVTGERLPHTDPGRGETVQHWREWELELVGAKRDLLAGVGQALTRAGATPSPHSSKLARTLGHHLSGSPPLSRPKHLRKATTAELLQAYVAEQLSKLGLADRGVRAGEERAVHKMRIAARRIRSALTTYSPVLDGDSVDGVREDLRWLGQVLGEARDAQVLRGRLLERLATQRPQDIVGPVAQQIDAAFHAAYTSGRQAALRALKSERYFRLLDTLEAFLEDLPSTPRGQLPARKVVPGLLARDAKRLHRAARAVRRASEADARDHALHEVRKKAKRLRYAADSATALHGDRAKKLTARARAIQESLGSHQDSVVARSHLTKLAHTARANHEDGFTYGRLHALEEQAAHHAESQYEHAIAKLPQRRLDHWLRH
jgi:CHAD domain-containing protein